MLQATISTPKSPTAQASVLMHIWSVRSLDRLVKLVSSSSGIICLVQTSDICRSIIVGIHVINGCLISMATRTINGSRVAWMFQDVQMTSRWVLVSRLARSWCCALAQVSHILPLTTTHEYGVLLGGEGWLPFYVDTYLIRIKFSCWVVSSVSWAGVKLYLFMEQLATFNKLFHFPLQMVFMAKHYSGGSLGDIALDDISFENCAQPLPPSSCRGSNAFRCDSGHCIDQSVKCDFEPDCCDSSEEKNSTCVNYNR